MTILPKKKVTKDKTDDNRDAPRSPNGEAQRNGHRRQANSPPRWNHHGSVSDDRSMDPGGRYEEKHHETSHKRRHRLSPHRTVRKQRHVAVERQSRTDRQLSRPVWVDTSCNSEASAHTSRTFSDSPDKCKAEEEGYNSEDEYPDPSMVNSYKPTTSKEEVVIQIFENM